jgi:AcrR family transcriptional regulator
VAPERHFRQPDKRTAVLGAATRLFLRKGYAEASVDAIAVEAGVAKQTIYNHFRDKEQLFGEVLREAQSRAAAMHAELAGSEEWLARSDNLEADLRTYGRRAVKGVLSEDMAVLRRLVVAELDRGPVPPKKQETPPFELALARALERQVRRGALDIPDVGLASRQFTTVLMTEAVARSVSGRRRLSESEVNEVVDAGVDLWLRAYSSRPEPGQARAGRGW